jgi:2,3-dihydroxyphenylpropionate 1,2-dioxygenase
MPLLGLCASHTPLKERFDPGAEVRAAVDACLAAVRAEVAAFKPDLVVMFGPDHFNGFFYRLMPPFCVGAMADSLGDWDTPAGPLPVASALAEDLVGALHARGIDMALSWRMEVDHGLSQGLQLLFDWPDMPPVIPVFINCAAPPRPPMSRVVALGRAVGEFLLQTERRVLVMGSGGLSHDPPMPALATATGVLRERLVAGGTLTPEMRAAREKRVTEEGLRQRHGESTAIPLNETWDHEFIAHLQGSDFDAIAAMRDEEVSRLGGCGGHEIRNWVATAAALSMQEGTRAELRYYRAIPEWVAGFGVMSFR